MKCRPSCHPIREGATLEKRSAKKNIIGPHPQGSQDALTHHAKDPNCEVRKKASLSQDADAHKPNQETSGENHNDLGNKGLFPEVSFSE